uniref:Uncharacterized protein n=1 Tax=viral metagenome TaxID=1070528 RepID=A0A6C0L2F3_9ZZZZ|tara:strand:+ start:3166 stop:3384 length:219 start_codon:yes stop_codon:yes gene_type:complete
MSNSEVNGIEKFDDIIKDFSNVMVLFFDTGFDLAISGLEQTKTAVTLIQQELIDIGAGDIIFSEKYFGVAEM